MFQWNFMTKYVGAIWPTPMVSPPLVYPNIRSLLRFLHSPSFSRLCPFCLGHSLFSPKVLCTSLLSAPSWGPPNLGEVLSTPANSGAPPSVLRGTFPVSLTTFSRDALLPHFAKLWVLHKQELFISCTIWSQGWAESLTHRWEEWMNTMRHRTLKTHFSHFTLCLPIWQFFLKLLCTKEMTSPLVYFLSSQAIFPLFYSLRLLKWRSVCEIMFKALSFSRHYFPAHGDL